MSVQKYKVGDIKKWRGTRNSDTGEIDGGYLYIITEIMENGLRLVGKQIRGAKNRKEAIEIYKQNL